MESKFKMATIKNIAGYISLAISGGIFLLTDLLGFSTTDSAMGLFFVHYSIACIYLLILIVGFFIARKPSLNNALMFMLLLFISSFALNRELPLFERSVPWLQAYVCLAWVVTFSLLFYDRVGKIARYVINCLTGASLVLYAYFALKLASYYGIGLFGTIVLGLGYHILVPATLLILVLVFLVRRFKDNRRMWISVLPGVLVPLVVLVVFLVQWKSTDKQIQWSYNGYYMENKADLPGWVIVSQKMDIDWVTERYLKSKLVYSVSDFDNWSWWDMPNKNFSDVKYHDPLVSTASLFLGYQTISVDEKIKVLSSLYNKRHEAQERLWTGKGLKTKGVLTNVKLFPDYRLAYTEKSITVQNSPVIGESTNEWNRKEAIYTFYLPEGSAVTSLSLWIDGKEAKGVLTTKQKAETAYQTIVGVEQRDPSLITWQEGNMVSVRVFPCTPLANRVFKIGITSPLRFENNELLYSNIVFDGPEAGGAIETLKVHFASDFASDCLFDGVDPEEQTPNVFLSESDYKSDWSVRFAAPVLARNGFSFNGDKYLIENIVYSSDRLDVKKIIVDLNQTWTDEECDAVMGLAKKHELYLNNNGLWRISSSTDSKIIRKARENNFSLIPFYKIKDVAHTLIITKGSSSGPNLNDLKETDFAEKTKAFFAQNRDIHVAVLGNEMPSYLKTLKELRAIKLKRTSLVELEQCLASNQFMMPQETNREVPIEESKTCIVKVDSSVSSGAPDHLLRLFAYNKVMKMIGCNYFTNNYITKPIMAEAVKAYVVSPVTSLVVLETQADYDRFDIKTKQKNSLLNASTNADGAAPEPYEWMLIIASACVLLFMLFRKRFARFV